MLVKVLQDEANETQHSSLAVFLCLFSSSVTLSECELSQMFGRVQCSQYLEQRPDRCFVSLMSTPLQLSCVCQACSPPTVHVSSQPCIPSLTTQLARAGLSGADSLTRDPGLRGLQIVPRRTLLERSLITVDAWAVQRRGHECCRTDVYLTAAQNSLQDKNV